MDAVSVVHLAPSGRARRRLRSLDARSADDHHVLAVGRGWPTTGVDVVVAHGRSGLAAVLARRWSGPVVYRPGRSASPHRSDRRLGRHVRWIGAHDPERGRRFAEVVGLPSSAVTVVADDEPDGWRELLGSALGGVPAPAPTAPRATTPPLRPAGRLQLLPVAVRAVGPDLLVAAPGPERDLDRLTGSGPQLWHLFAAGLTLDQATRAMAAEAGVPVEVVRPDVETFAAALVARRLARPT